MDASPTKALFVARRDCHDGHCVPWDWLAHEPSMSLERQRHSRPPFCFLFSRNLCISHKRFPLVRRGEAESLRLNLPQPMTKGVVSAV